MFNYTAKVRKKKSQNRILLKISCLQRKTVQNQKFQMTKDLILKS